MAIPDEKTLSKMSVAEVALAFPSAPGILNQYKIDFCCGGTLSFASACEEAGLNATQVYNDISRSADTAHAHLGDVSKWKPSLLIDYIVQVHHTYVRETIPQLTDFLDKTFRAHGSEHPELIFIRETLKNLAHELLEHLDKEERILFPAIKESIVRPEIAGVLDAVEAEHRIAGDLIKALRKLTSNYSIPPDACTTYSIAYQKLEEFDRDLMQHIHLENNVLLKKVIKSAD